MLGIMCTFACATDSSRVMEQSGDNRSIRPIWKAAADVQMATIPPGKSLLICPLFELGKDFPVVCLL